MALAEYDKNGIIKLVRTEIIDGDKYKANTWYSLIDGDFKEVEE